MSQISWDSPLLYFWEKKNSKINPKTWFTKTQALSGLDISLNYFQKKIYKSC